MSKGCFFMNFQSHVMEFVCIKIRISKDEKKKNKLEEEKQRNTCICSILFNSRENFEM
jgi:hypothetical protein